MGVATSSIVWWKKKWRNYWIVVSCFPTAKRLNITSVPDRRLVSFFFFDLGRKWIWGANKMGCQEGSNLLSSTCPFMLHFYVMSSPSFYLLLLSSNRSSPSLPSLPLSQFLFLSRLSLFLCVCLPASASLSLSSFSQSFFLISSVCQGFNLLLKFV